MNFQTDVTVLENLQTAVMIKNDETTITKLEGINRALEAEEPANVLHGELLKTQAKFNKMIIKRIKTGKY